MKYHIYQRSVTRNGNSYKLWYYWYYDENGKQVRKSCRCTTKRDAIAYVEKLLQDEMAAERLKEIEEQEKKKITFESACENFYDEDSLFIKKQRARGIELMEQTLYQKRHYLQIFLAQFGDREVKSLKAHEIENWLLDVNLSYSVRNAILTVIVEVYKHLYSQEIVENIPYIEKFKRSDTKPKGILSIVEIQYLFPADYDLIIKRWRTNDEESESDIIAFMTMIYAILSTGMRSCEVRALQYNQLIENRAILLNAMFDSDNNRVSHLKKGDKENKKWRVVVLPQRTIQMISKLQLYKDVKLNDFIFTYDNKPYTTEFLLRRFKNVLENAGIEHDANHRNITIHSLRFTYNTLMRNEVSESDLRLMVGHASKQMTDYYDKSKALDHLPELLKNQDSIDRIFN